MRKSEIKSKIKKSIVNPLGLHSGCRTSTDMLRLPHLNWEKSIDTNSFSFTFVHFDVDA